MNRPCPSRRRDRGFTLIELLVVIVILGILMALLLPVIFAAYRNARDSAVVAEMTLLQNAIAQFKVKYGDYPPSRIMLSENGFYPTGSAVALASSPLGWNGAPAVYSPSDLTLGQLADRSVRFLRKFWPRAQFSTSTVLYNNATFQNPPYLGHDFNGNGQIDAAPIYLEGHEALAFFLGGIPNHAGSVIGMDGFGKNPSFPFLNSTMVPTSREPSMFTFQGGRLIDDDNDGIPGYVDSLGTGADARYYAYFSSYGQNGYDPNDVNFAEPDDLAGLSTTAVARNFRVAFAVTNPPPNFSFNFVGSFAPNPYTVSDAVTLTGSPSYHNPNSFQIISSGRDRHYGIGGQYLPDANNLKLPFPDAPAGNLDSGWWSAAGVSQENLGSNYRQQFEQENLANFATSRLDF